MVPRQSPLVMRDGELTHHARPQKRCEAKVLGAKEPEGVELAERLFGKSELPQREEILQAEMKGLHHSIGPDIAGRKRARAGLASLSDGLAPAHVLPLADVVLHQPEERPDGGRQSVREVRGPRAGIELLPA